jgi:hypothetical protein
VSIISTYISKQRGFSPSVSVLPCTDLQYSVVIPCFKEEKLLLSLESLKQCERPKGSVEVLVVVNYPENVSEPIKQLNQNTYRQAKQWAERNSTDWLRFYIILYPDLPKKIAGVGTARKLGMDEAALRFEQTDNPDGFILGFDADSTVSANYFTALDKHLELHPKTNGIALRFEHPTDGNEFSKEVYNAIILYELYLRYYRLGLKHAGFPYWFYTVGSSFAVRASIYAAQGGMNKRKAGEDFYFLHKVIPLGEFYELNSCCVYPSPRPSDRVPFGTGAAVNKLLSGNLYGYPSFHPDAFVCAASIPASLEKIYHGENIQTLIPNVLFQYLNELYLDNKIVEIKNNAAQFDFFVKRFYVWFNGLRLLQFFNQAHPSHFPLVPVRDAALEMLIRCGIDVSRDLSAHELLLFYREKEKSDPLF